MQEYLLKITTLQAKIAMQSEKLRRGYIASIFATIHSREYLGN